MEKNAELFDSARKEYEADLIQVRESGKDVVRDYKKVDGVGKDATVLEYAVEIDVFKQDTAKEFKKVAQFFNKKYGRSNLGIVSQPQGKKELWLLVSKWMKNVNDEKIPTELDMLLYKLKNLGFTVKEYENINNDANTNEDYPWVHVWHVTGNPQKISDKGLL